MFCKTMERKRQSCRDGVGVEWILDTRGGGFNIRDDCGVAAECTFT